MDLHQGRHLGTPGERSADWSRGAGSVRRPGAIVTLLLSLIPLKFLAGFLGLGGVIAGLFIKGKIAEGQAKRAEVRVSNAIVENHAVAVKEEAAKSDEDADAALDASAHADR